VFSLQSQRADPRPQQGEGLELNQIEIEGFVENPAILDNVEDPVLRGWVSVVNSYWSLLIRQVLSRL
jgi:alpha,alpha-trehalase